MARPRGFAKWEPKEATLALLDQVATVLDEYEKFLPVTARQVFYRLVGQFGYDKTEQAYARLCEHLVRARRNGMIPFASIRDDGTSGRPPQTFADVDAFWSSVENDAKHYSRNRLAGQPCAVELWCEAAGMVPQLQRVAFPFSIPVYSTGGFSSVTVTHEIAQRALKRDVPTVFLHVGDYDPSGESIFDAMSEDARMFVRQVVSAATTPAEDEARARRTAKTLGGLLSVEEDEVQAIIDGEHSPALHPRRVALTRDQVEEHDLPTAPPKRTDSRSVNWIGQTCQLEAMPPDVLASTVRDAIEAELDMGRYEEEYEREQADEDLIATGIEAARAA